MPFPGSPRPLGTRPLGRRRVGTNPLPVKEVLAVKTLPFPPAPGQDRRPRPPSAPPPAGVPTCPTCGGPAVPFQESCLKGEVFVCAECEEYTGPPAKPAA